jgi:hypothetical protein
LHVLAIRRLFDGEGHAGAGRPQAKSSIKGVEDMKTTEQVKTDTKKLDLSVKSAGELAKVFVTPGMMFNKA